MPPSMPSPDGIWIKAKREQLGLPDSPPPAAAPRAVVRTLAAAPKREEQRQEPYEVPSLFTLNFMTLATVLDQFVHAGYSSLISSFIPSDLRASLLAVARRRGLLDDDVLHALLDDSWTSLDLSRPQIVTSRSPWLTSKGIISAVAKLPNLEALDISGCDCMSVAALHNLAPVCPKLRLLRIGGSVQASHAANIALPDIVPPSVIKVDRKVDSWEEAFSDDGGEQASEKPSVLPQLKYIVWPAIHPDTRRMIELRSCDHLLVNPDPRVPASTRAGALARAAAAMAAGQQVGPSPLDSSVPLDEPLAAALPAAMWADMPSTAPGQCTTPFSRERRRLERRAVRRAINAGCKSTVLSTAAAGSSGAAIAAVAVTGAGAAAGAGLDMDEDTEEELEYQPPIAVRFQMAYREQAVRLRQQGTRQQHVVETRALRDSSALRAVSHWLDSY